MKLKAHIIYIKSCKKEELIHTFTKVYLAIKSGGLKIKKKIAKLVMETEIEHKQYHLRKIQKDVRSLAISQKSTFGVILFNMVTHQLEVAIQSHLLSIKKRHIKNINYLRNNKRNYNTVADTPQLIRNTIHNFSSYILSRDEELALMYGMDQNIPSHLRSNVIKTEFELFCQGLLKNIEHLPENTISQIKTKLQQTCENYSKIPVLYKYKQVINNLPKNNNIVIIMQDKGRGVVIMDKTNYQGKCLALINTNQFVKLKIS